MFQSWRLRLREAEEAFREGRLDEAEQLLEQGELRRYLPGKRLSVKVAEQIAQRARQRMLSGESSAGWRDLDAACSLSGGADEVLSVRTEIVNCVLREAEGMIIAGEPGNAVSRLESLEKRGVGNQQVRPAAIGPEAVHSRQVRGCRIATGQCGGSAARLAGSCRAVGGMPQEPKEMPSVGRATPSVVGIGKLE